MSVQEKSIRYMLEEKELSQLSPYAAKSKFSKGRARPAKDCDLRTGFQRDRDKILHSKAFRRLKHKTQVFFSPNDDHYRTRMTHTLEVSQIARTISKALSLNEDLTEAIALGHDLGHTPFGHSGEEALNEVMQEGYKHNEQSIRVVTHIEDLNLSIETLDGILNHTGKDKPITLEGQIVKISDRIAYINHDIQDALRAGVIKEKDLPKDSIAYFSSSRSKRLSKMVYDIVENSFEKPEISMTEECSYYLNELRAWMFDHVYLNSIAKSEENKAKNILKQLFFHYCEYINHRFPEANEIKVERTACDYISGMTDRYALIKFEDVFLPKPLIVLNQDEFLLKLATMNGL